MSLLYICFQQLLTRKKVIAHHERRHKRHTPKTWRVKRYTEAPKDGSVHYSNPGLLLKQAIWSGVGVEVKLV